MGIRVDRIGRGGGTIRRPCSLSCATPPYINAPRNFGQLSLPLPHPPPVMALLTFAALFFTFDFAVIGAALLIHAFIASNDQVDHLRAVIPRGTVLNVNRDGGSTLNTFFSTLVTHTSLPPDITTTGKVSTAVHGLIIALVTVAAYAVFNRSKTRPKFFAILGSLFAFTSLWLLSLTIAFTVIFATKSARVSASLGGVQLPQSIIDAQSRALGVSPIYKDQSYRELQPWATKQCELTQPSPLFSPSRCHSPVVHLVVHDHHSIRSFFRITWPFDTR